MKTGGFPRPSNLDKSEYEKLLTSVSDRLCIGGVSLPLEFYFRSLAEADESRMRRPGDKWHRNCLPQSASTPVRGDEVRERMSGRGTADDRIATAVARGPLDPEDWTGFRAQTHDLLLNQAGATQPRSCRRVGLSSARRPITHVIADSRR
jgi:hypothetical protein